MVTKEQLFNYRMQLMWNKDHAGPWLRTNDLESILLTMRPCWSPRQILQVCSGRILHQFYHRRFPTKIPWKFLANVLFLVDGGPPRKMKNLYRINASVHLSVMHSCQGRSSSSTSLYSRAPRLVLFLDRLGRALPVNPGTEVAHLYNFSCS